MGLLDALVIDEKDKERVLDYLKQCNVEWEVIENV